MHPCPVFNCVFTRLFEQTNSATQTEDQRDSGTRTKVDVECGQRVKMENVSIAWDLLRSDVSLPYFKYITLISGHGILVNLTRISRRLRC